MQNESLQDDEIHHSVGKVNFEPCPEICHTQFTRILLDIPLSPPPRLPACAPQHRMLGKLLGLLKSFAHNERTYQINYNISYTNTMNNFGQIFINSMADFHENNYYTSLKKHDMKDDAGVAEDSDTTEQANAEVAKEETAPAATTNCMQIARHSESKIILLITRNDLALPIMNWLHVKMDPLKDPREKLIYLRAVCDAGFIPRLVSYPDYCDEFGPMPKSSYYKWMGTELNYSKEEINEIKKGFPFN